MHARNRRIRLRFGNETFETTAGTLTTMPSIFPELLDNLNNNEEELELDRDGEMFALILNFMRDGEIDLPDESDADFEEFMEALLVEAEYFQLDALFDFVRDELAKRYLPIDVSRGDRTTWRTPNIYRLMRKECDRLPVGLSLAARECSECESTLDDEVVALFDRPRCELDDVGRVRQVCGNGRCANVSFGFFKSKFHLPTRWLKIVRDA